MSKDLKGLSISALPQQFAQLAQNLSRYRVTLFILLVAGTYGFISYKIFTLSSQSVVAPDVSTQVTSLTPHIDIDVVDQLESLKDNSVNVQTLFESSRDNPFSE